MTFNSMLDSIRPHQHYFLVVTVNIRRGLAKPGDPDRQIRPTFVLVHFWSILNRSTSDQKRTFSKTHSLLARKACVSRLGFWKLVKKTWHVCASWHYDLYPFPPHLSSSSYVPSSLPLVAQIWGLEVFENVDRYLVCTYIRAWGRVKVAKKYGKNEKKVSGVFFFFWSPAIYIWVLSCCFYQ